MEGEDGGRVVSVGLSHEEMERELVWAAQEALREAAKEFDDKKYYRNVGAFLRKRADEMEGG